MLMVIVGVSSYKHQVYSYENGIYYFFQSNLQASDTYPLQISMSDDCRVFFQKVQHNYHIGLLKDRKHKILFSGKDVLLSMLPHNENATFRGLCMESKLESKMTRDMESSHGLILFFTFIAFLMSLPFAGHN